MVVWIRTIIAPLAGITGKICEPHLQCLYGFDNFQFK